MSSSICSLAVFFQAAGQGHGRGADGALGQRPPAAADLLLHLGQGEITDERQGAAPGDQQALVKSLQLLDRGRADGTAVAIDGLPVRVAGEKLLHDQHPPQVERIVAQLQDLFAG